MRQYPPTSGGEADGGGGYCSTPKDEEGIKQYLRAMLMVLPLYLGENRERSFLNFKEKILKNNVGIIQYLPLDIREFFFYCRQGGIGQYLPLDIRDFFLQVLVLSNTSLLAIGIFFSYLRVTWVLENTLASGD